MKFIKLREFTFAYRFEPKYIYSNTKIVDLKNEITLEEFINNNEGNERVFQEVHIDIVVSGRGASLNRNDESDSSFLFVSEFDLRKVPREFS